MRIGELARASGLTVATVKFYLRERLLPAGEATAPNQADYGEGHLRRLRLVRTLIELGQLSITDTRAVVEAVDNEQRSIHEAFCVAQDAMAVAKVHGGPGREDPAYGDALARVDTMLERHGLRIRPDAQVRQLLADVIVAADHLEWGPPGPESVEMLVDALLPLVRPLAEFEVATVPVESSRTDQMEHSVIGTLLVEATMSALRRMALEDASQRRFLGSPDDGGQEWAPTGPNPFCLPDDPPDGGDGTGG